AMPIDTRQETAARIRPGMTRAEVEQIIGGREGDYRVWARPEFQAVHGNRWRRVLTWTCYHGRIEMEDGEYGIGRHPVTGRIDHWSTSRGVVDSVRWSPVTEDKRGWHPAAALGATAAVYFGLA